MIYNVEEMQKRTRNLRYIVEKFNTFLPKCKLLKSTRVLKLGGYNDTKRRETNR
jgi:hypothetical protein